MAFPMVPPTAEEERRLELIQYIEWAFHDFNGANFFTPEEADGQQTRQRFSMRRRVVHRLPPVQLDPFEEGENDDWASADEQEEAGTSRSSNGSGSISNGDGNNSLDGSPPTGPELLGTTSQRLVDFRLRALAQVYELLVTNRHATKRDLFYESKSLYQTQANFDRALSAVCKFLDASRSELHVISCSKGFAVGDLRLYNAMDEAEVDFGGGMPVPITEQLTKFDFAHSEAKFLLVVEKDSVFQRLLDERWAERFPNSILVTGRGYPDICTRLFLSWLALKFPSMPMLALVDADPYGIEIFLTYKFGSERSRVETGHVDLHRLQWIGFLPSETEQLAFPADQVLPLVPSDRRKIEKLGGRLLAHGEQAIYDELAILLRNSWKLEIEALCALGPQFLTAVYLNHKLEQYIL